MKQNRDEKKKKKVRTREVLVRAAVDAGDRALDQLARRRETDACKGKHKEKTIQCCTMGSHGEERLGYEIGDPPQGSYI